MTRDTDDSKVKIAIIAAMSSNRVIGRNNKMPWHYKKDFAYFKRMTIGKPVIMGRRTYESLAGPLPDRHNIVVTRNPEYQINGVSVCSSLDEALLVAKNSGDSNEIMIIGGSQIYREAMPIADIIYLTEIHHEYQGDAFFPELSPKEWREEARDCQPADAEHPYAFDFVRYGRV